LASPEIQRFQLARADFSVIYAQGCDDWYFSDQVKVCEFGTSNAPRTAMAIGDSVALQWFPAYARIFEEPGWRLLVATKSSCPMVDEPLYYPRIGREYSECDRWRKDLLAKIAIIKPDVLVFGSTYTYDFSRTQWIDGTVRILEAVAPAVGHVYVMRSTPVLPFDGPSCLEPRSWLYNMLSPQAACTASAQNNQSDAVYRWLEEAAHRFANVDTVDMTDVICPNGTCSAQRDGMIVFQDTQHMTASYARTLAPTLEKRITPGAGDALQATAVPPRGLR
jgi:hypothetical protein